MTPLRILAVGNMYPPHHQGGYELVWQAAMTRARERGHKVRILVSTHREAHVQAPDEPDVHRTLRWYWDWHRHVSERLTVPRRIALERANAAELRRHLRAFRPDIVTWWSMGHMSLGLIEQARRAGVPSLFSVHNDWLVYGWRADQWMRLWRDRPRLIGRAAELALGLPTRVALDRCGPVLFNSRYMEAEALASGVSLSRSEVIPPGIDGLFASTPAPGPWRMRLAYVGRLDPFKGVDMAIDSLVHLPVQAHLSIHGKGDPDYASMLRAAVERRSLGGRVHFGPFETGLRLRAVYEAADAVVFPVRGEEPWGLVPIEAMAAGRLVISTARGGTAEFIRDGVNAIVIPPDEPEALARAVLRLDADPELRERLRAGGRETAARHTSEEFDRRTVEAIEEAARR